jgi:hypothetical protein
MTVTERFRVSSNPMSVMMVSRSTPSGGFSLHYAEVVAR